MKRVVRGLWRLAAGLLIAAALVLVAFRIAAALREREDIVPPASRLVATPLGAVAVRETGPAAGPAIVLVPGTAAWGGFWRHVADHLGGRGWHVIAVDLPPFGYSERDPAKRYDRASQAQRLAFVIAARAGRPAVVVAHSFGSGAAVELALRRPNHVARLVLVDAALGGIDPKENRRGAAERVLRQDWIAQLFVSATITNPLLTGRLLRGLLANEEAATPWVDTIREPMARRGTTAAYAAWLPNLLTSSDGALSRSSANLARIRVPVALIWGDADTVTPPSQGERLARLLHARSFVRLPGVGHIPHIEDEAGFLAALDTATDGGR